MVSALSTFRDVFVEVKVLAQSIKRIDKLGEDLEKEVLLTESMVDDLQKLLGNNQVPSDSTESVGTSATGSRPHSKLGNIENEVMTFQKTVEDFRSQMQSIEKSWKHGSKILLAEETKAKLQMLLTNLRLMQTRSSWLIEMISM